MLKKDKKNGYVRPYKQKGKQENDKDTTEVVSASESMYFSQCNDSYLSPLLIFLCHSGL